MRLAIFSGFILIYTLLSPFYADWTTRDSASLNRDDPAIK